MNASPSTRKPIETEGAPAPIGPYSQAVIADGVLYCSGQVPLDPASGELIEGGVAERYFTRGRAIEPGKKSEQCGFAGSRGTDDGHGRARIHVEADIIEDH